MASPPSGTGGRPDMPFKSQAQRGKFYAMEARGEISAKTVKHFEDATPKGTKLPYRVKKQRKVPSRAGGKRV